MTHADSHPDDSANRPGTGSNRPRSSTELVSSVVRNESAPNRRTIYPARCGKEARLTTWLSANDGAFVPLDEAR